MAADLHCHSTASDGSLTPAELVRLASKVGLCALGLTDHDTVNGISEAEQAGREFGVEIVPGLELNTDYEGSEIHVLGYYPDLHSEQLRSTLLELRKMRFARVKKMLQKLADLDLPIDEEHVLRIAGEGAVGRPHVAQAMRELGYVRDVKEAFEYFLGQGRPAYVSRYKLTPAAGIELIAAAGGIPVLAHPGSAGRDDIIPKLIAAGLKGIEVYHTSHTKEMELKYAGIAEEAGLLLTGGSDFHGPGRKLGIELGDRAVSMDVVAEMKRQKEKR